MTLKEQLEKYRWNNMIKSCHEDDYIDGFNDCLELLYPLVEALDVYKNKSNWTYWSNRDVGAFKEEWTMWKQNLRGPDIAEKALQELREKLK